MTGGANRVKLSHCCLVYLTDATLACGDANSKLVDVVTVADVDAEKRVDDSCVTRAPLLFCVRS